VLLNDSMCKKTGILRSGVNPAGSRSVGRCASDIGTCNAVGAAWAKGLRHPRKNTCGQLDRYACFPSRMTIAVLRLMSCRAASSPSISGITKSITVMCGRYSSTVSMA